MKFPWNICTFYSVNTQPISHTRLPNRHSLARFVRPLRLEARRFCCGVGPDASRDFRRRVETARGGVTRDSPQSSRDWGRLLLENASISKIDFPDVCLESKGQVFVCFKEYPANSKVDVESFSCMIVINQQSIYSFFTTPCPAVGHSNQHLHGPTIDVIKP